MKKLGKRAGERPPDETSRVTGAIAGRRTLRLAAVAAVLLAMLAVLACGSNEGAAPTSAVVSEAPTAAATATTAAVQPTATSKPEPAATAPPATATPPPAATATPPPAPTKAPDKEPEPAQLDADAMTFTVGDGSQGLFKVDEVLRGLDVIVALETGEVSGTIDLGAGNAELEIDLHSLESDQPRRDRYVRERMFPSQPVATVRFDSLGDVPESFFTSGEELITTLPAIVNVNGTDAEIEFGIIARLDNGVDLVVLGKSQFTWAEFGMTAPVSGFFTVADDVVVEILLQAKLDG